LKKTVVKSLYSIFALIIILFSCQKKDDSPKNYIEIDGVKHALGTSHVTYIKRLNDVGELNYYYQIQLYGEDYQILFDSDGRYYSEKGEDLFVGVYLESEQAITLESTFYENRIGVLRDTNMANEYSSFRLYNFEGRSYDPYYLTKAKLIYIAMENRQLELITTDYKVYSGFTASDSIALSINLYYKGPYHYSN